MCDDECPDCGARDMSPFDSEDLTEVVGQDGDMFVALRSPDTAEHSPDYRELGRFGTRAEAMEFLASSD
jgi:hypothetical protein